MASLIREEFVYEVLQDHPETAYVFHRFGIALDPECTLETAAREAGADVEELLRALEGAIREESVLSKRDWSKASLRELTDYVQKRYHVYLRYELPRLRTLLEKMLDPELARALGLLLNVVDSLAEEMTSHLDAEENVLFRHLEDRERGTNIHAPQSPEADAENSAFRQMQREHDRVEQSLAELRRLTLDFSVLQEAAGAICALNRELRGLEPQLREHIRLENEFLWPGDREREPAQAGDQSIDHTCPRTGRPCPVGDPAICRRFWECVRQALGVQTAKAG